MEKSSKAEYVAVPTSDVEQEVGLPPYQEQEQDPMAADKTKRRRRLRFLLIGGAITLLGLTHVCTSDSYDGFSDLRPQDAPEPCALRHLEQYKELKHHMEFVENAFGEPHHGAWDAYPPPPPLAIDEPHHHHKHHKGHKGGKHHHKHHHDNNESPSAAEGDEKPHHRHGPHHKHEDGKIEGAVQKFDGDHHKHYEPFCKAEDLISKSSVFEFSPEDFKRAGILSGGFFDKGSHIVLSKSSDASLKKVRVNVTVSAGREDLAQEVKVSAFDHDGEYSVQVEHGYFHHRPHHRAIKNIEENDHHHGDGPKKENCLIYDVNVEFPADLDYFDQLNVKAKGGFLKNGKGIEGVEFGSIRAAIGRGAVIFDGLRAKNLLLGVFRGVVMGTYQPSETFSAGTVHGASKVKIEPTSDNINITASSTFGPASVDIPADSFKGRFALFNLFGEPSTIEAPNPEDIHVQRFKPTIKSGYYKEDNQESRVVVAAKLKGGERLTFY
ncbi:hypothetical protein PS6_006609 [Mucor atramentarius]